MKSLRRLGGLARAKPSPAPLAELRGEADRLWDWALHEDNLLATRVSFFLLAQSVLIAVTATVVSTSAGFGFRQRLIRVEVFGLAMALSLSGVVLTLTFWYIFMINFNGLKVLMTRLKLLDDMYRDLDEARRQERITHWHFRVLFHHKGANWAINNLLPVLILFIWLLVTAFSIVIFVSR